MMIVRPLLENDLPEVLRVQRDAHPPALVELPEVFGRRIALFPQGAIGAFEDELAAYLFCHPWTIDEVATLHRAPAVLPDRPTCIYVHDLAVHPHYRGRGLADRLVNEAKSIAADMSLPLAAVAVNRSERFWERHGLARRRELDYGPQSAIYMVKP
jgi:GNAT superfamily N-acetyltransferase